MFALILLICMLVSSVTFPTWIWVLVILSLIFD